MQSIAEAKRSPMRGRMQPLLLLALLIAACAPFEARGQAAASLEYRVKAVFLLNFIKFVEWPADSYPDAASPITICVLGEDPFGSLLEETVKGETVNGRALAIKRVRSVEDVSGGQIVFVSASEKNQMKDILNRLKGRHVLTVGETNDFLELGGVIRFT